MLLLAVLLVTAAHCHAQSAGACYCLTTTNVNVRATACGTVIGSAGSPNCYTATGQSQTCSLGGTSYTFFALNYGATTGWIANNYLALGSGCPSGSCPNIISRAGWGARPPRSTTAISRPVPRVFIHHTTGSSCYTQSNCAQLSRNHQNYHMDSLGWSDVGYNFLVGEDGNVYEGRGWLNVGAHAGGWNSVSYGITVIGTFTNANPNSAAQQAVQNLISCGVSMGHISSWYTLHGHRGGVCTECPGQAFYNTIRGWSRFEGCLSGGCGC